MYGTEKTLPVYQCCRPLRPYVANPNDLKTREFVCLWTISWMLNFAQQETWGIWVFSSTASVLRISQKWNLIWQCPISNPVIIPWYYLPTLHGIGQSASSLIFVLPPGSFYWFFSHLWKSSFIWFLASSQEDSKSCERFIAATIARMFSSRFLSIFLWPASLSYLT